MIHACRTPPQHRGALSWSCWTQQSSSTGSARLLRSIALGRPRSDRVKGVKTFTPETSARRSKRGKNQPSLEISICKRVARWCSPGLGAGGGGGARWRYYPAERRSILRVSGVGAFAATRPPVLDAVCCVASGLHTRAATVSRRRDRARALSRTGRSRAESSLDSLDSSAVVNGKTAPAQVETEEVR